MNFAKDMISLLALIRTH